VVERANRKGTATPLPVYTTEELNKMFATATPKPKAQPKPTAKAAPRSTHKPIHKPIKAKAKPHPTPKKVEALAATEESEEPSAYGYKALGGIIVLLASTAFVVSRIKAREGDES
jgi:hypothetical protein